MERLLTLAMIVKNEAASIHRTLRSCFGAVDNFVIVDTGSTDDTVQIVRETLRYSECDFTITHRDFIDFATTRNEALNEAYREEQPFVLMLSGDEILHDGKELREFCRRMLNHDEGGYFVRVKYGPDPGELWYDSTRLTRTAAGWRYEGATHECVRGEPPAKIRVPVAAIRHPTQPKPQFQFSDKSETGVIDPRRARWEADRKILEEALERDPNDPRATYYLAQTLECLEQYGEALHLYSRRTEIETGTKEEVFESKVRIARLAALGGAPGHVVEQLCEDAMLCDPGRTEPLLVLAYNRFELGDRDGARAVTERALKIPFPEDCHFLVDSGAYHRKFIELLAQIDAP